MSTDPRTAGILPAGGPEGRPDANDPASFLGEEILSGLDRHIAEQDAPRPGRAEALRAIVEDWLTSRGHIPLAWKAADPEA